MSMSSTCVHGIYAMNLYVHFSKHVSSHLGVQY